MRALLLVAIVLLNFGGSASAETRTFPRPRIDGMRLDWCLTWARDCGRPAANAFCERRGFEAAMDFSNEPNVGVREPTRLITGQICNGDFCNGFGFIACTR